MADPAGRAGWVGLGFERYFKLRQAEINRLLGPQADLEVVLLHALSVISHCLFGCLAGSVPTTGQSRGHFHTEATLPLAETITSNVDVSDARNSDAA